MMFLNTFDVITVSVTFCCFIIVQLINSFWQIKSNETSTCSNSGSDLVKDKPASESSSDKTTPPLSPLATPTTTLKRLSNGKKFEIVQSSNDAENGIAHPAVSSNSHAATHSSNPNTSLYSNNNNGYLTHTLSFDTLADEYHEDEDTLSLENLFPCDQSEIYASRKISFIIDELIQTESNYVNNLRKGLQHYGTLQHYENLPDALRGDERQQQLLSNIQDILQLHEQDILPLMLRNQRDLKGLFDELAVHFDKNSFYCYVIFTMGKKTSMQLRQENREFFQCYQTEINDKLGIDSFLVQPIQRLTRYPLLLQQFISEFYKSGINCKPVLTSVCKLETRMRRLLDVVNQAEEVSNIEDATDIDLQQLGYFRRATEFDGQHFPTRKKYRVKVFLFDRCLICTEVRKRRLSYRQHYNWATIELQRPLTGSNKSIVLLVKGERGTKREEYALLATESAVVKQWLQAAHKIIVAARYEDAQRGKFSLPMDLVLAMGFAIWWCWHYL